MVLDEIARREPVVVTDEELDAEIARFAERSGRTPEAVRAQLEKDNGAGAAARRPAPREDGGLLLLANASDHGRRSQPPANGHARCMGADR